MLADFHVPWRPFAIDGGLAYGAIYCPWGNELPTQRIVCNGMNLLITAHLHEGQSLITKFYAGLVFSYYIHSRHVKRNY
jgi:hypothetical protein